MEIKEKLEIFNEAALAAANAQSESLLEEYKKSYQNSLAEYEQQKQNEQATSERIAEAKIRKEINRQVSEQALVQKRRYHEVAEQKKEILFSLVEEKLKAYEKTDAYQEHLATEIKKAKKFAKKEPIIIYLNGTDAALKESLEQETKCELTISEIDFMGGIRAVIRSRNVLIDESFSSKLEKEREEYSF